MRTIKQESLFFSRSARENKREFNISYDVLFNHTFNAIAIYSTPKNLSNNAITAEAVHFIDVNSSYERIMKVRRQDLVGRSFADVWPNAEPRWAQIIVDCLRQGHTVHTEGDSLETGSYLEAIAFPMPPDMAAVVFLDKTQLRKSDKALERKQEELRSLATQMTLIEENTRRAIATDLHDRIGYDLVSQLNKIRKIKGSCPPEIRAEMEDLEDHTEKLISVSRSLIFELSPPILKEVGLNPALEALAENLLEPHGIRWNMRTSGTMADFWADDKVCVLLYRMARELLINVIKHAEATRVTIIVNRGPGRIMVAVEDNGKGFPPDFDINFSARRGAVKSFGLFSIKARLEPIGGSISVISQPGEGATVAMTCPLALRKEDFQ
ncbi:MAG: sensor histidine kinase [Pyramidobacter sp.]